MFSIRPVFLPLGGTSMPSFDFVAEVDPQLVDDAVNQVAREISQRFDFRNSRAEINFKRQEKKIYLVADDEYKLRALHQLLGQKLAKRNVDIRCLIYSKEETGSHGVLKQNATLKDGLSKEETKQITKLLKETCMKIQTQVQDNQLRVSGKKIDDLQNAIKLVEEAKFAFPVRAINMRS